MVIRDIHLFLRLHQSIGGSNEATVSNTILFCPMDSSIRKSWIAKALPWVTVPPLMSQNLTVNFANLKGHRDWVRSIAFSPDGRYIASGSDDSGVRIWDAEMGTTQHRVEVRRGWIHSVAFSSQGIIAAASDDDSITMWMASTGREIAHLEDQDNTPYSLCFSPDGTKLAATCSARVLIWEAEPDMGFKKWNCVPKMGYGDNLQTITFSPDGKLLATGSTDGKIHMWDIRTGALLRTCDGHNNQIIKAVAFSKDGKLLASGADDGNVVIWNVNRHDHNILKNGDIGGTSEDSDRPLYTLEPESGVINSIAFSPDSSGSRLAAATDVTIRVWDTKTGAKCQTILSQSSDIRSIAFGPNGSYLASASTDNSVHLWYAATEATNQDLVDPLPGRGGVHGMTLSPDGRTIAAQYSDGLFLWDVESNQAMQRKIELEGAKSITSIAFSPTWKYFVCSFYDGSVRIYDFASGKRLHRFNGHTDWVQGLAWSYNEDFIASASDDHTVRVWKIGGSEVAEPIQVLESAHGSSYVTCVAFSPGGEYLVTGGIDRNLVVWNREEKNWHKKGNLIGHTSCVANVLVTSDSQRVISCSHDKTVRIWDIETEKEKQIIKVEWSLYNIWFPPQGEDYIMSHHGALSLNGESLPPTWSPWRLQDCGGQWWITLDDKKALILPSNYSPTSACILGDKIIIGTSSQLYTYELSRDRLREYWKESGL